MPRRNATNPDSGLSPQQLTVGDLLAVGATITDAAKRVGVCRQTVSDWVHHNPRFRAHMNRRRRESWVSMTDHLRSLVPKALEILAQALEEKKDLTAAIHTLKACGLYGNVSPAGPTSVEEVELEEAEVESARRRRAQQLAGW
jgi:hypothetical protein